MTADKRQPHQFIPAVELETTAFRRCEICGQAEWAVIHDKGAGR